jgi:hypothetical protein
MATTVSYESAMANLKSMFSSVDSEVIAMILQSNAGHMERTVEHLLAMTSGAPAAANNQQTQPQFYPIAQPVNQSRKSAQQPQEHKQNSFNPNPLLNQPQPQRSASSIKASDLLPEEFLRPNSWFIKKYGSNASVGAATNNSNNSRSSSQIDQDAILAQMLQDQEFVQEIQQNRQKYQVKPQQSAPQNTEYQPPRSSLTSPSSAASPNNFNSASQQRPSLAQPTQHIPVQGFGSDSNYSAVKSKSFSERWNSLTAAAKQKFLALSDKIKTDKNKTISEHAGESSDTAYSALSDNEAVPSGLPAAARQNSTESQAEQGYLAPQARLLANDDSNNDGNQYFDEQNFEVDESDELNSPDPFLTQATKNKAKAKITRKKSNESADNSQRDEPLLMEEVELQARSPPRVEDL